ncbi:Aspartokinase [Candidatus Vidania fulgoroideae]|nr:Aspartokinase [Candidatus Vidania fulgoroideae]
MKIRLHKYGGKSLGNIKRIKNICNRLSYYVKKGYKIVSIISAMGNTTERIREFLIKNNIFKKNEECDSILSIGEQFSISILSLFLKKIKIKSKILNSFQIPILTKGKYGSSRIFFINKNKIYEDLKKNDILLITGFQGINLDGNITTLSRGGSDTTALEVAKFLKLKKCYIYTDVSGIFSFDPNCFKSFKRIKKISYKEMIELASSGSKVMSLESLYSGLKNKIKIYILSSFKNYTFDKKYRTLIK